MATTVKALTIQQCSVQGCNHPADYKVFLADHNRNYGGDGNFYEQDISCPWLCEKHQVENEAGRKFYGKTGEYPYSKWGVNWSRVSGWTEYERLPPRNPD